MTALASAAPAVEEGSPPDVRPERGRRAGPYLVLAVVAYVPLLLTRPGQVVADTKQYLYLDPGGVLRGSQSLWDPDWALGTVTHQSIGYLWPMGPWYRVAELVGLSVWTAQRLWIGTILFAAGAGIVFLGRVFGWGRRASTAAGLVYLLSPYPLTYATRISALILPWAGLPWLVGLGVLSLRRGGWRDPARLALVATTVGAVNASSLLYAGLAVVLWFPFAVFVHREASPGKALAAMARIGVLLSALSLWWVVALAVQGRYGPDILRFSETLEVVASGSPSTEAFRGLGYWIFYGGDRTGPWVGAGAVYTQNPAVLVATFAMAVVSLAALLAARWRYRAYLLTLAAAGIVLTVGLYPYEAPGTAAALVRDGAAESTLALALRSSPRALPLYLLAVVCAVAVALDAAGRLRPRTAPLAAAALVALAAAAMPLLWTGRYLGEELARDDDVPEPWRRAAAWLDAQDPNHRALILPGSDFSAHRWGNTIDHVLPGLTDRPVAVRELVAFGSAASSDLLIALDRRLQERLVEPDQVGPVVRLLGAGSVVLQSDLEFERYRTPRPRELWALLAAEPDGLGEPVPFGPPYPNEPSRRWPMLDETELGLPIGLDDPPQVAALPVTDPLGVVRVHPAARPVVVAGDGESLLELAGAGLLPGDRVVLYEAALDDAQLQEAVDSGAEIVITDGNRQRARRWKTIRDNLGLTESPLGDGLRPDPTDARLDVFPDAPADSFTVAEHSDVQPRATAYGNPISYHPEDRAFHAVDADPATAWRVGAFSDARGERLELTWDEPAPGPGVTILQPVTGHRDRWITDVELRVNGAPSVPVALDERSLVAPGQVVDLGVASIETLELEIVETSAGRRPGYSGLSAVGLAEVTVERAPTASETIVLPRSVARRVGALPERNPLTVVVSRERVDPASAVREDPEQALVRRVELPAARRLQVRGTARLSAAAPEVVLDDVLGHPPAPRAVSSDRIPGPAGGRASAVLDDDPSTMWRTPFGAAVGQRLTLQLGEPRSLEALTLRVAADGRHSVPTSIGLRSDTGDARLVALPAIADGPPGATVDVPVEFAPIEGHAVALTLEGVREVPTIDWYSGGPIALPVGIADVLIPGVAAVDPPVTVPGECRSDLIAIDGQPLPVRIAGDSAAALAGRGLDIEACGAPVALGPGPVTIETAPGRATGIDVDRLVLHSPGDASAGPPTGVSGPDIRIDERGRDRSVVTVQNAASSYWLVLGESYSSGWRAEVVDGPSLSAPVLADGFANGWLVDPAVVGPDATIELRWAPNRWVRSALAVSALAAVVVVALAILPTRRRRVWRPLHHPTRLRLGPDPRPVLTPAAGTWSGLTAGFAVAAATRPVLGVAIGVVVASAGWWRWTRSALAGLAVVFLAGAGAYVTVQQLRYAPPHDGAWPSLWDKAHLAGWVSLASLIGAALIEIVVARRSSPTEGDR